jgi:hypothetical protein
MPARQYNYPSFTLNHYQYYLNDTCFLMPRGEGKIHMNLSEQLRDVEGIHPFCE